jgi:hypothetical protein
VPDTLSVGIFAVVLGRYRTFTTDGGRDLDVPRAVRHHSISVDIEVVSWR